MDFETLLYHVEDGIATITLNRPDKLNAIDAAMRTDLAKLPEQLALDSNVRVAIFTGAGRAFSSGGDVSHFEREWNTAEFRAHSHQLTNLFNEIEALEKPVIAALNGVTAGAGLQLALACDLRIASDQAKIGFRENFIGLIPGHGGTSRLAKLIGVGRAKELIFMGELIDAHEAKSIGLIGRVVAHDELMNEVYAIAGKLCERAPQALGLVKRLLNSTRDVDVQSGLLLESLAQSVLIKTEDHQEGIKAFREKRKPKFEGK